MDVVKLILIVIFANLLIGVAITANNNFIDNENIYDYSTQLAKIETDFFSEENRKEEVEPSTSYQFEKTVGKTIGLGSVIFDSLLNGLNPIIVHEDMWEGTLTSIVAWVISFIRLIIGVLLGIEAYFVFKNRKYS